MESTPPFLDPPFLDLERPPVPDIVEARGVLPFHLSELPVRGRLVRLGALADALITRHDAPDPVLSLTGQALALVAGLAAALKFRGSFSLQAKGDGPVPMLLADCTDVGAIRGYALTSPERLAKTLARAPNAAASNLLGFGHLAFTVDQGDEMERHQGIVAIEGDTLSDMARAYFRTSEQLRCFVRLAAQKTPGGWRASALILERIASDGGHDAPPDGEEEEDDAWVTATALAATVKDAELLDDELPGEDLLYRLFHEYGVRTDLARALSFGCRCSRGKLAGILETFGADDLDHMAVDGGIVMTCEFCNYDFRFTRDQVGGE